MGASRPLISGPIVTPHQARVAAILTAFPAEQGRGPKTAESPPSRGRILPYDGAMPDYALLAAHLATLAGPRVTLTFAEVEAIIGGPLPLAARLNHSWWRDHPMGRRSHGGAWIRAGWQIEAHDAYAGTVTFARGA
jgi:hypothetical protein